MNLLSSPISSRAAPRGLSLIEQPTSTFSFAEIPGIFAVYDASQISTLYQNDSKSQRVTSSGQSIGAIADLLGGHDLLQSVSTKQPMFKSTDLNGGPCVVGDGVDDVMETAAFTALAQPFTVVLCGQWQTTPTSRTPFDGMGSGSSIAGRLFTTSNSWNLSAGANIATGVTCDTALPHLVSACFNGSSSSFRNDGDAAITGNAGPNQPTALRILQRFGDSNATTFRLGLCVIVAGLISDVTFTQLRAYCRTRWGVA